MTSELATPRSVACPGGAHIKPSVTQNTLWIDFSNFCNYAIPGWFPGGTAFCSQIFPTTKQMNQLCAIVPPDLPTIDWNALALNGQLWQVPEDLLNWVLAYWTQLNWNTFCECIPNAGDCPTLSCGQSTAHLTGTANAAQWACGPLTVSNAATSQWMGDFVCYGNNAANGLIASVTSHDASDTQQFRWNAPNPWPVGTHWTIAAPGNVFASNVVRLKIWHYSLSGSGDSSFGGYIWNNASAGCTPTSPYIPPGTPAPPTGIPPTPPNVITNVTIDQVNQKLIILTNIVTQIAQQINITSINQNNNALIVEIGADVDNIETIVTNIENNLPAGTPDYVLGLTHTVLGPTDFAVSGILGLSVEATVIPDTLGHALGDPDAYFDLGFLTWGTDDGWVRSQRLTHTPWLELPVDPRTTRVAVTPTSGVTLAVTELVPSARSSSATSSWTDV